MSLLLNISLFSNVLKIFSYLYLDLLCCLLIFTLLHVYSPNSFFCQVAFYCCFLRAINYLFYIINTFMSISFNDLNYGNFSDPQIF